MGRRIKEEPRIHRERIAEAAEKLFLVKGIGNTTVTEIAEKAGYSKATLYVYFKNKEEMVSFLIQKSMTVLYRIITENTSIEKGRKENFMGVCNSLVKYRKKFPMYFELLQSDINVNFDHEYFESDLKTYSIGEEINEYIIRLLDLKEDGFDTVFLMWGALCGVISMAETKKEYLSQKTGKSTVQYLEEAFEKLFLIIRETSRPVE